MESRILKKSAGDPKGGGWGVGVACSINWGEDEHLTKSKELNQRLHMVPAKLQAVIDYVDIDSAGPGPAASVGSALSSEESSWDALFFFF